MGKYYFDGVPLGMSQAPLFPSHFAALHSDSSALELGLSCSVFLPDTVFWDEKWPLMITRFLNTA